MQSNQMYLLMLSVANTLCRDLRPKSTGRSTGPQSSPKGVTLLNKPVVYYVVYAHMELHSLALKCVPPNDIRNAVKDDSNRVSSSQRGFLV